MSFSIVSPGFYIFSIWYFHWEFHTCILCILFTFLPNSSPSSHLCVPPYVLRQSLSLDLKVINLVRLTDQWIPETSLSPPHNLELQASLTLPSTDINAGDPNSGSSACTSGPSIHGTISPALLHWWTHQRRHSLRKRTLYWNWCCPIAQTSAFTKHSGAWIPILSQHSWWNSVHSVTVLREWPLRDYYLMRCHPHKWINAAFLGMDSSWEQGCYETRLLLLCLFLLLTPAQGLATCTCLLLGV